MTQTIPIRQSVSDVFALAVASGKPPAVILAGHNGSGKSTMWYEHVIDDIRVPLINADRMILSTLPEKDKRGRLRPWAQTLRDTNTVWMQIAQKGTENLVGEAMANRIPFATETVFSYWKSLPCGGHESKIDLIRNLQATGYFVMLLFVGLSSAALSLGRVNSRAAAGGHTVSPEKILARFSRTQKAIKSALTIADAALLVDNSRDPARSFTPCYVRTHTGVSFDIRSDGQVPQEIARWLNVVVPDAGSARPTS